MGRSSPTSPSQIITGEFPALATVPQRFAKFPPYALRLTLALALACRRDDEVIPTTGEFFDGERLLHQTTFDLPIRETLAVIPEGEDRHATEGEER